MAGRAYDSDSEDDIEFHVGVDGNLTDKSNKQTRSYKCDKCEQPHDQPELAEKCKCNRFCRILWYPTNYMNRVRNVQLVRISYVFVS